jgi:hypothetical protein
MQILEKQRSMSDQKYSEAAGNSLVFLAILSLERARIKSLYSSTVEFHLQGNDADGRHFQETGAKYECNSVSFHWFPTYKN